MPETFARALIIGAGIGGLAAASALARHFTQVVVLERDELLYNAAGRPGTPQAAHVHGLLAGGLRALERLLPGFEGNLVRAGAVPLVMNRETHEEAPGIGTFPPRDLGFTAYSMSRSLLESTLRRRVEQLPNVVLQPHCRVMEILASPAGDRVTGVRFENSEGRTETLTGDLVIDASGRGSPTLDLLRSLGRALPEETRIGINIRYSTALFAIPADAPTEWRAVITYAVPPDIRRSGVIIPVENGEWMMTVAGRHGDWPPEAEDELREFVKHLQTTTISDALRNAERISEIRRYAFPESVWRHFERLTDFPERLLPIGDAICRFNPIYGQGMSVAALESVMLEGLLQSTRENTGSLDGLAGRLLAEAAPMIAGVWGVSVAQDFGFPQTQGKRPDNLEAMAKYSAALHRLVLRDPELHQLLFEVRHMLKPPTVLREPALAQRVQAEMQVASAPSGNNARR